MPLPPDWREKRRVPETREQRQERLSRGERLGLDGSPESSPRKPITKLSEMAAARPDNPILQRLARSHQVQREHLIQTGQIKAEKASK